MGSKHRQRAAARRSVERAQRARIERAERRAWTHASWAHRLAWPALWIAVALSFATGAMRWGLWDPPLWASIIVVSLLALIWLYLGWNWWWTRRYERESGQKLEANRFLS